jgi:hypothetical protein
MYVHLVRLSLKSPPSANAAYYVVLEYLRAMTRNLMRSYLTILKCTALARSPTLIQPARLSSTGAAQNSPGPPYTQLDPPYTQTMDNLVKRNPGPPYT